MSSKPKIYIAGPFFNPEQVELINSIELVLLANGYEIFSPRIHSGSDKLSPEERKDPICWRSVFDSNVRSLDECHYMLAVLEYPMPKSKFLGIVEVDDLIPPHSFTEIELPDAGTVWECGYFTALGKCVVGFHRGGMEKVNLMLSHGCVGLVSGYDQLSEVFNGNGISLSSLSGFAGEVE